MSIFSRRKRLLNRTPKAPKMSSRRQFHRALRRHPAWPAVMEQAAARARAQESIRRSAGVAEMGTVSHRKRLRRIFNRNRTNVMGIGQASNSTGLRRFALPAVRFAESFSPGMAAAAWRRSKLGKKVRRNRVLLVTLLVVGGLVVILTGISMGNGQWIPTIGVYEDPGRPKGRFGAATTFIEDQQQMLVFGGFVGSTSASDFQGSLGAVTGPPILNDDKTHLFRKTGGAGFFGGGWQSRDPVHRPSARGFAAAAYDGARKNVVLFGGAPYNTNNVSGETWIWDNQDWVLQNPPEPRPDPRQNAVMVYDAHRKVVVMFGGRGADGKPMNDTWTWNGSAWKIVPRSDGDPSPRHSAAIAYDFCRAEAVMFGGVGTPVNNTVSQPFETWTWNGAKWTQQNPKVSPPPRIGAGMAYSTRTGNLLLYGGLDTRESGVPTAATDHDVWRWAPDAPTPGGSTGWERMNSEVSSAYHNVLMVPFVEAPTPWHTPPPRAYASFIGQLDRGYYGSTFDLYGGTPSAGAPTTGLILDNSTAPLRGAQVVYGDHFGFGDYGDAEKTGRVEDGFSEGGGGANTPLTRRCVNPVPIPPDAPGQIAAPEAPKLDVREGMREIGRFPVLVGTEWPDGSKSTHIYPTNPPRPNPDYTPAPDCPRRRIEDGTKTYLFTDQKRNRVYQFFLCDPYRGEGYINGQWGGYPQIPNLLIGAYDGTTLKSVGTALLRNVDVNNSLFPSNIYHDVDRGAFLIRSSIKQLEIRQDLIEKGVDPIFSRTDPPPVSLDRYFNHPKSGSPKAFYAISAGGATVGPPPASSTPPKLAQWNIESARQDWQVELPDCTPSSWTMHTGNRVYAVCSRSSGYAVATVPITANADGTETPGVPEFYGTPKGFNFVKRFWADPQAERMLFVTEEGGTKLWVFDGKTSRFVGRTGIGGQGMTYLRLGFNRETGRLYIHMPDGTGSLIGGHVYADQGGLLQVDTRLTPVPQLLRFPQFASPSGGDAGSASFPIAALPSGPGLPPRVFIRRTGGNMKKYPNWETVKFENEMFYRVMADEVLVPKPADLSELDLLTIPVAETPGKTEVSFDAEGSGYGIRLRSLGGIWSTVRPFSQIYQANGTGLGELAEGIVRNNASYLIPACVFPDRELMAGFVPQARLSDLDALARSSGLEVDSNSKTDLEGPFSRCNPTAEASDFPASVKPVFDVLWPLWGMVQSSGNAAAGPQLDWDKHFKEVECVGDALATNTATVGNVYGSAKCAQRQGLVEATARGSASGVGPLAEEASKQGFSVGEGYSKVVVAKELVRGVVVTSTAVAKGIQIPNLTIGVVTTTAVAWSNGRPGEGRAKFTRAICNVNPPLPVNPASSNDSAPSTGCLTENQQKALVKNWNDRWGINSKMILPAYDLDLYRGSPGGYIAGVIKPVADEVEDQLFAKDFQREVPGLVIEFNKDTASNGQGRQVLQLAAVRAVAGLGVQCNPDLVYSPQSKDCVALAFEDDPVIEEFFEEEESEDGAFNSYGDGSDGTWTPVEATGPSEGLALGSRIGRALENLPVLRRLPIRQMGEALLAASVWLLFLLPPLLASRRFALSLARKN